MPNYQFKGDHQSITIEGITFVKGQTTTVSADETKRLQASGFWQPMLDNAEIVEVKEDVKPLAKTGAKATTKEVMAEAAKA